jgi:hypothetical protein
MSVKFGEASSPRTLSRTTEHPEDVTTFEEICQDAAPTLANTRIGDYVCIIA